jgi:transmembrane sensor
MQDSIRIEEIAADWLARRDREDWADVSLAELTAWLEASSANRVAYIRLNLAWAQTRHLKVLATGALSGEVARSRECQCAAAGAQRALSVGTESPATATAAEPPEQ